MAALRAALSAATFRGDEQAISYQSSPPLAVGRAPNRPGHDASGGRGDAHLPRSLPARVDPSRHPKREAPAEVIGNAVHVRRIATGEIEEEIAPNKQKRRHLNLADRGGLKMWEGPRQGRDIAAATGTAYTEDRSARVASVMTRPKVSFDSANIWRRLETCQTVAQAHGWHPNDIINFAAEVREAFSYEEAMTVIQREFDIVR
ncbi:MAG TPA: hypothetical protein VLV50_02680 [Stellaceae bacterium]|nr:hypothetical protein [Stellaceae bacterium]